jgi:hypothetical protein
MTRQHKNEEDKHKSGLDPEIYEPGSNIYLKVCFYLFIYIYENIYM